MCSPSGEQHEIRHGDQIAVLKEVGATLRAYTAGGVDVVDGFAVDEMLNEEDRIKRNEIIKEAARMLQWTLRDPE